MKYSNPNYLLYYFNNTYKNKTFFFIIYLMWNNWIIIRLRQLKNKIKKSIIVTNNCGGDYPIN
jgi:hypothetical protein